MRDIPLYMLIRERLISQVPLRWSGPLGYAVRYQPTQQGRPSEPTVWMHKLSDRLIGQRKSASAWNGSTMVRTEVQRVETTMQISATRDFQPDDSVTASDCVNILASVMQSDRWIESLRGTDAQVLRVSDIRLQRTLNDRNQWEETPTFDVSFVHNNIFIDGQPVFSKYTFDIYRI